LGVVRRAKYYAFCIRRTTTTNLTADQIHQIGLDEVKRDEAEMLAIAQKLGLRGFEELRASLKTNPKLHPRLPRRLWQPIAATLGRCRRSCRSSLARLPKAPLEVAAVPDYIAKNMYPPITSRARPGRQPAGPFARQPV